MLRLVIALLALALQVGCATSGKAACEYVHGRWVCSGEVQGM